MYSKLCGVPGKEREKRIQEVLIYLDLGDRAHSMVNTYSGGMMRRLELAQALVNRPRILFLDEPSIGLDPGAKTMIWQYIKDLRRELGTTVFINTHDMGEADALCDRIGIMNRGKLVIVAPPSELKASVGGDVLTVSTKSDSGSAKLKELGYTVISESSEDHHVALLVSEGERLIPHLLDALKADGVEVEAVSLKKPTLDDVFLKYTGTRIEEGDTFKEVRRTRRTFRRLTK